MDVGPCHCSRKGRGNLGFETEQELFRDTRERLEEPNVGFFCSSCAPDFSVWKIAAPLLFDASISERWQLSLLPLWQVEQEDLMGRFSWKL